MEEPHTTPISYGSNGKRVSNPIPSNNTSVGQTSHRHSIEDKNVIIQVLQAEREIRKKKLLLLKQGLLKEPRQVKIDFRTWKELKDVYLTAPDYIKTAARHAFESVILAWYLGQDNLQEKLPNSPVVMNLNLNIAEAKAEAKAEAEVSVIVQVKQMLDELMEYVSRAASTKTIYRQGGREVEAPLIHPATAKQLIGRLVKLSKLISN